MEEKKEELQKEKKEVAKTPEPAPAKEKEKTPAESTQEQIELLAKLSKISLWLDDYNDIFSDFDPRSYSERAMSEDFLNEAKRRIKENPSGITELSFLVPAGKRDQKAEEIIKKRLRAHFKLQFSRLKKESFNSTKKGLLLVFLGIITMFIATYVLLQIKADDLWSNFLVILLEPAGWFLFWEGLGIAFFRQKKESEDLEFNRKMAKCKVSFAEY
ncbi:MAG: hypothetical protein V1494_03225 [Candidatus Diapherotrites archaeon]